MHTNYNYIFTILEAIPDANSRERPMMLISLTEYPRKIKVEGIKLGKFGYVEFIFITIMVNSCSCNILFSYNIVEKR